MNKKILIFGGSGFIGSSLTESLLGGRNKVCVVCSDKNKALKRLQSHPNLQIQTIDIFDKIALQKIVKGHNVVINLIGKLFEVKKGQFAKFHYKFPELLSKIMTKDQHLIHISALGIEESAATSIYAKTKLDGQNVIIKNSKNYNIVKPSIVFGEQDGFFNLFAKMAKFSPFLPLIGGGMSKFAPIYVMDLVKSIICLIDDSQYKNRIFEAYGNKESSFKELMRFILRSINKKRFLIILPFFIAKLYAKNLNVIRVYILTSDQVELLKYDNIGSGKYDNIDKIIGKLKSYEEIVPQYLLK